MSLPLCQSCTGRRGGCPLTPEGRNQHLQMKKRLFEVGDGCSNASKAGAEKGFGGRGPSGTTITGQDPPHPPPPVCGGARLCADLPSWMRFRICPREIELHEHLQERPPPHPGPAHSYLPDGRPGSTPFPTDPGVHPGGGDSWHALLATPFSHHFNSAMATNIFISRSDRCLLMSRCCSFAVFFIYFSLIYSYIPILPCLTPHHRTSNCARPRI